jgi:pantoate--beta-alanine ligase
VNPLQFAAGEDFDRYPRTLEHDLASVEGHSVDAVFAPPVQAVYPDWPDTTATHRAGKVGDVFEGAHRPGHFDGVLTVVARLFDLVQPTLAVFGQKDAQQLFLVTQMAAQRVPPVEIVAVETVRADDGLARSSRNVYLSEAERHTATALSAALMAVKSALLDLPQSSLNTDSIEGILTRAGEEISRAGLTPDYLELVSADDFSPWRGGKASAVVAIVACPVGGVRLLDSVLVAWSSGMVE